MSDPTQPHAPSATGPDADSAGPLDATVPRAAGAPLFAAPLHAGELGTLGRYRVLQELGKGGMGAVYLGYDAALDRKLALKVMLPSAAADATARERFLREARTAAKVKSDHVVTIHDVGEAHGTPFIAMEYLLGAPLDLYLKKKGELPLGQAVRVARECALGLAAVHDMGLVHRDIKPGNVWLEAPNGRVKLLDFGLARGTADDVHITGSGAVVGTVAYMSPEQGKGEKVDHRTDLWSLGVMLYRLCTGRMPFEGETAMVVLTGIAVHAPAPPRALNATVPPALEAIILKLLEKDRFERFQSAGEVVEALAAIERGDVPQVVAVPVPQPMQVGAQTQNVWESIADDSESVAVPLADRDATEAEVAPARAEPRRASKLPLVLGAGVLLAALAGLVVAVLWAGKKPDVAKKDDDQPPLPPAPKEANKQEQKPKGKEPTVTAEGTVYPLPPDLIAPMVPVKPEKVFSLDWLDPAKHVPAEERYDWQPKELVALLGSHRQRAPQGLSWVRVSPDGAFALAGNNGKSWKFDLKSGRVSDDLPFNVVSEDLRRGANGNKVYDLTAPAAPPVEYANAGEIFAFLTDDLVLAARDARFAVCKLDGKGGAEVVESYAGATYFALSPDRKYLAFVFAEEQKCRVYDVLPTELKEKFALPGTVPPLAPLFSATGVLAAIETGSNLRAWDVTGAKPELRAKLPFSNAIHLTQNGAHLVSPGAYDFELYTVHEKPQSWNSSGGESRVTAVASARDGSRIVTAHTAGEVRVWELTKGVLKERSVLPARYLLATPYTDVSPDGRYATVERRTNLVLLDFADLSERVLPVPGVQRFSASGAALFTGGTDGLRVRGVPNVAPGNPFADRFAPLCDSPDGKWVAATTETELGIWDVSATPPKELWKVPGMKTQRADFTPDGRFLIARLSEVPHKLRMRVWALTASGPKVRYETDQLPSSWDEALSPDGRTLAVCHFNGTLTVYRVEDGVPKDPVSLKLEAKTCEYSPNGRALLVTTAADVKLVSGATGEVLHTINTRGAPHGGRFHPDGKHVFVTNADRTTYVLRLPKEVLEKVAGDADRRAIEWVFSVGGIVYADGDARQLKRADELPVGAFRYHVVLEHNANLRADALAVFRDARNLIGLNAHSTNVTDANLAHVPPDGLRRLDLHSNPQIADGSVAHFKTCKALEHLNLAATGVGDTGLAHFKDCANLAFLDVQATKVTAAGLAEVHTFTKLETLRLSAGDFTDKHLAPLAGLTNLTELFVEGTQVTKAGAEALAAKLPKCKILYTGGTIEPKVAANSERTAAEAVLRLRGKVRTRTATGTRECSALGDLPNEPFSVVSIALYGRKYAPEELAPCRACRNLASLQLDGDSVTDECLAHFANCGPLTELAITSRTITNAGLEHFANQQFLSNLSLSSCTKVTGTGIAHFKDCKALVVVSLSSTKVTDGDLAHTAAWGKLGSLYLVDTAITDAGLVHLERLKNLAYLNFDGSKLTDAGLKHLEGLRVLRTLSLRHMQVTEPALKALKLKLHPDCLIEWDKGTVKP